MFGGGVVGGGVFEIVKKCMSNGKFEGVGSSIEIAKICVRNLDKPRDYAVARVDGAPPAKRQRCESATFVTSYDDILKDDSINCVVEVMGGTTDAKDVIFAAIAAGKHVASPTPCQQHGGVTSAACQRPTIPFPHPVAHPRVSVLPFSFRKHPSPFFFSLFLTFRCSHLLSHV